MIATKPLPSQDYLRRLLDYDPETGLLTWHQRPASMFKDTNRPKEWNANAWNAKFAGKRAFAIPHNMGYYHGCIDYKKYLTHRIIWKWMIGEDPAEIDHDDGDRRNNRFVNLIPGTHRDNMRNVRLFRTSSTGVAGVYFKERDNRWVARIRLDGKFLSLGSFLTIEEAAAVRKAKQIELGFGRNHGLARSGKSQNGK